MEQTMRSLLVACTIAIVSARDAAVDHRFAVQRGSIHLNCNLPVSADPDVEWVDKVYGSEQKPERIFHSRNNSHFGILKSHQNNANYKVDHEFGLTIANLDMESDVGQYICRSRAGDKIHHKKYYLTIGELPACSGETNLRSGGQTQLSCEMEYSGQNPNLEWLEDGEPISSIDEYEIRLARKVVNVHATYRHDGLKFQCRMTIGSVVHECDLTLNVTYGVHQPKFHPDKENFEPGEEIKCTAKGNPKPIVTLNPGFPSSSQGSGWAAFIVEDSWIGQEMKVQCAASNVLDGVEVHSKSHNISFGVTAPKRHEHNHHHHHHQPQEEENKHFASGEEHPVEERPPASTHKEKPQHQPEPKVKSVRSDNSGGILATFSVLVVILSLSATVFV